MNRRSGIGWRFKLLVGAAGLSLVPSACGDSGADPGTSAAPPGPAMSLSVDARARACDVLIVEEGSAVEEVAFGDGVQGTYLREAPHVAISLIAVEDEAISPSAIELRFASGEADIRLSEVRCADVDGDPIEDADIVFGG